MERHWKLLLPWIAGVLVIGGGGTIGDRVELANKKEKYAKRMAMLNSLESQVRKKAFCGDNYFSWNEQVDFLKGIGFKEPFTEGEILEFGTSSHSYYMAKKIEDGSSAEDPGWTFHYYYPQFFLHIWNDPKESGKFRRWGRHFTVKPETLRNYLGYESLEEIATSTTSQ